MTGLLDRQDRTRQHHLQVELARVGIAIADGMTEQVGTDCESDVGHFDHPLPKLLSSGVRIRSQGIALQEPDERDEVRTLLRSRRSLRLGMTRLKRTHHEHRGDSQSAK